MPSVERTSLTSRKHGWLVSMVNGKKKLGLNEREIRAAENRKRLAQVEEMKIQRRRKGKERKPSRKESSIIAERSQKPARNKMQLALMQEGKITKRLNKKIKPVGRSNARKSRRVGKRGPSCSEKKPVVANQMKDRNTTPKGKQIQSKSEIVSTASDTESVKYSPPKVADFLSIHGDSTAVDQKIGDNCSSNKDGVNSVKPVERYSQNTTTNEVSPNLPKNPNESEITYILSLDRIEEKRPWAATTGETRSKQQQEKELQEATINEVISQPKLRNVQSLPTRLSLTKRKKERNNWKKQHEDKSMSLIYSLPQSRKSKRNSLPILMKLKEVETQKKTYRTQVFMDWRKKRRSSIKRVTSEPKPNSRKLTGLDPEVIALTQREIAECAEKEAQDADLIVQRRLTGVRDESESKLYISGWLEDLESPREANGGLY